MNFQVADWYVDVDANRIQNHEQDIKLESKVMLLLVYLAKNQGSVVSREQLEADVWTGRVISYDALTSCITRLRKVLGDNSRHPVYIETVPKKGYRLIAQVSWDNPSAAQGSDSDSGTSETATQIQTKHSRPQWHIGALALIFLIAITVSAVMLATTPKVETSHNEEMSAPPSIIVLPFENLSNLASQDYFSVGITTDISIALAKLSGLQVIAEPSLLSTGNRPDVKHAILARYVMTGSVQRDNDQLRVNVMLIDNKTHQQLWAESYDREITAMFEVQDDITAKIVSSLSIKLTEEEKKRVAHRYTNSIQAYDHFLRGQALYTRHTHDDNTLAREQLLQAIQLDPLFARAYSTLALTYVDDYRYQWQKSTDNPLLKTLQLAEKAVSLDDSLPQAYWALAYAQLYLHRYEQAIDTINRSFSVLADYADGYAILALIKIYQGDAEQGIKMIQQAMRLNPDYPAQYLSVLGQAYYFLGDYENAMIILREAINNNFSLLTAHIILAATLNHAGLLDEASWNVTQLHSSSPEFTTNDIPRIFPLKDEAKLQDIVRQLALAGLN
ncbi:MAG: winged helix-turn-helix domain-containing protein [Gammaproteobacteria bacterium]|nr:winged helix-turn-helix domain-containing protein [Gammaproteobacteria bacterium]